MNLSNINRLDILNFKFIEIEVYERINGGKATKKKETVCDVEAKDKGYFYKFRVQKLKRVSSLTSTSEFKEHLMSATNRLEFNLTERIEISRIQEISKTLAA